MKQGAPFCKQCRAPQIRVLGVEPEPPLPAQGDENSSDVLPPPSLPTPPPPFPSAQTGAVQWSRALPGAALGGVFSLLASMIPYALLGPAFLLGGGLAVMLYRRASGGVVPTPRAGARIGAASGGFGFLYAAVLVMAIAVYYPDATRNWMLAGVSQMTARGYAPEQVAQAQELIKSPGGVMVVLGFLLFIMLLIVVAGSSIGGAFYAAWSRRRPRS